MARFKAIGLGTNKVYSEGETKAECFRRLIERYPTRDKRNTNKQGRKFNNKQLLPEAVKVYESEGQEWMS